jgi:hypothetical protein
MAPLLLLHDFQLMQKPSSFRTVNLEIVPGIPTFRTPNCKDGYALQWKALNCKHVTGLVDSVITC